MTVPVLTVEHLTCDRGGRNVLNDVSFSVNPAERLAVLGGNGAGKTTLFALLDGLIRPQSGSIILHDVPIAYSNAVMKRWRTTVGFVFQNPDDQVVAPTVEEDVSFGPVNLGLPDAEIEERIVVALETVRILHLRKKPTHQLSFGEKKLTAIAGMLAMNPEILMLDEPTAGLDPIGTDNLLAVLNDLARAGKTILFSTHDVALAYRWSDRMLILAEGTAVIGEPETLLRNQDLLRKANLKVPEIFDLILYMRSKGIVYPPLNEK